MINGYSIILPTLNEVGHIEKLILDISKICTLNNTKYEIITVDDNSTDGTIDVVKKIKNGYYSDFHIKRPYNKYKQLKKNRSFKNIKNINK